MKRIQAYVKNGPTFFLRMVVILIGLGVLLLCAIALPIGILSDQTGYHRPILVGMYVPAVPFFIALHQSLRLLRYIDEERAFSNLSVIALSKIKKCGITISALYAVGMPYIFHVANLDDAPGVVAIGFVIIFASLVVAVFAAVLQKLLKHAITIKTENDLTI